MARCILIAEALLLTASAALQAPSVAPGEIRITTRPFRPVHAFQAQAEEVQVEVVVRDPKGRAMRGLERGDFQLYEDGHKREIAGFAEQTSAAATVVSLENNPKASSTQGNSTRTRAADFPRQRFLELFFDDLNTPPGDLAHAKIAALRFLREAAGPEDRVGVFSSSAGAILEPVTDHHRAEEAVSSLQSHLRLNQAGLAACPRITPYQAYRIVQRDSQAMQAAVEEGCNCPGVSEGCSAAINGMTSADVFNPTAKPGGSTQRSGDYGSNARYQVVSSVSMEAEQIWQQTEDISRESLAALHEALLQLKGVPGRRVLVLASSGFLASTLEDDENQIINTALHDAVVINALDAKGLYAEAPTRPFGEPQQVAELPIQTFLWETRALGERLDSEDAAMEHVAEGTGGLLFRNNNDLDLGFRELGLAPEVTYLLSIKPKEDGRFHKLKVEVRGYGAAFVEARSGYFAPSKIADLRTLNEEAFQDDSPFGVPAEFKLAVDKSRDVSLRTLTIRTHVDARKTRFEQQEGRYAQKLRFIAVLSDPKGTYVSGKEAEMGMALQPSTYRRLMKTGITGAMSFQVLPGLYRLRILLMDETGKITAETRRINIE